MMRRLGPYDKQDRRSNPEPLPDTGSVTLPARVPSQTYRPAQAGIPNSRRDRQRLRDAVANLTKEVKLVPPLTVDELRRHGTTVCRAARINASCQDYAAILVNNEAWRATVASVPYERRLLLLPKCLRSAEHCQAPIDEFGLVCQGCGQCVIHYLHEEARRLGCTVLVAEGTAVVTELIETGQIDAIIGVSCMSVLEKCFPHMESRAVPGVALPLLQDGCASTSVDLDWILDALHMSSDDQTERLNLSTLRAEVQSWFTPESLAELLGPATCPTEEIAYDWLSRDGKRWRPFLTTCVYLSLSQPTAERDDLLTADLKRLAIAVECFHKASLVHDDIEDADEQRYGQRTLHVEYGVPVALNVGDYLLGLGYRLLGELDTSDATQAAMLRIAAAGHLTLSHGQGAELYWVYSPRPLASLEVLDIFREKTAPAFEVALRLGACYAQADENTHAVLCRYSEALGIAYQIRDDLEDFTGAGDSHDMRALRPSLILAVAHKRANESEREITTALWCRECDYETIAADLHRLVTEHGVLETVASLQRAYVAQATRSLHDLDNPTLKGLLRRVIGRIFGDDEIRGYCSELEARDADGRGVGPEPAA
ncbi:MAG: polyprenyl synthetase family protein [Planctomycetota bacterium]